MPRSAALRLWVGIPLLVAAGAFALARFGPSEREAQGWRAPDPAEGAPYILPRIMPTGTVWRADAAPVVGPVARWSSSAPDVVCTAGTAWYALRPGTARLTAHGVDGDTWSVPVEVRDPGSPARASAASAHCPLLTPPRP